MLEILKFIFSSFWIWLGTFFSLIVIMAGIVETVGNIPRRKKGD
jgi:hypothetical protein